MIALAGLLLAPLAQAHHGLVPGQTGHADLAITDLDVPRIVVDMDNRITVRVRNNGPEAGTALLTVLATDPDAEQLDLVLGAAPIRLDPNAATHTESFVWDGRLPNDAMWDGQARIVASLTSPGLVTDPTPTNDERAKTLLVQNYDFQLTFDDGGSSVKLLPGQVAEFPFEVANIGNVDDTIRFSVSETRSGWQYRFARAEVFLPRAATPSSPATNTLFVTVGPDAAVGTVHAPVVVGTSRANPVVQHSEGAPTIEVLQRHGVFLSEPNPESALPGTTAAFDVVIKNLGNGDDEFELSVPSLPPGWQVGFDGAAATGSVAVPRGADVEFGVQVVTTEEHPVAEEAVQIRATASDGTSASTLLRVRVLQSYALSLELDPISRNVDPAVATTFTLRVRNEGNGRDVVAPGVSVAPSGWNITFNPKQLTMGPDQTATATAIVVPRAGEQAGRRTISFSAASLVSPSARVVEEVSVFVNAANGVAVTGPDKTPGIQRAETIEVPVVVQNTGNLRDKVKVEVTKRVGTSPDPAQWTVSPSELELDLAGGEVRTVTLLVTAPSTTEITSQHKLLLRVRGSSLTDTSRQGQDEFEVTARLPDLVVRDLRLAPQPLHRGETATLSLNVANIGDRDVVGNIDVTPTLQKVENGVPGAVTKLTAKNVAGLAARASKTVTFELSTGTLNGKYLVGAIVDDTGRIEEQSDVLNSDNNQARLETVVEVFDVRVAPPAAMKADTGSRVHFTNLTAFRLRNDGTREEQLTINTKTDAGWRTEPNTALVVLGPGEEQSISVLVEVPSEAVGVLSTKVTLTVQVPDRPKLTTSASTRVDIQDKTAPQIHSVDVVAGPRSVGVPVPLRANVTDNVGVSVVRAVVVGPDGRITNILMTKEAESRYAASSAFGRAGNYSVHVEALDQSSNLASSLNASLVFQLEKSGTVTAQLIGWSDGTRIRAGRDLQVSFTATGGLQDAYYVLDGVQQAFQGADLLTIRTSTWTHGLHTLQVVATSVTGAEYFQQYSVQVDNEAPGVTGVELNPTKPKAGEVIRVVIYVDGDDVDWVQVVAQPSTGAPKTVRAEPVDLRSRSFVAIVTLESGLKSLKVQLADDVGNVGLAMPGEFLSLLAIEEKGNSPSLGFFGALVALAVGIVARRKRWNP